MKQLISILVIIAVIIIGFWFFGGVQKSTTSIDLSDALSVSTGVYEVSTTESTFNWSGKKPLIDGYINSGTIDITEGEIVVENDTFSEGSFVLDMNTLHVGLTAKKPGQEGTLEGHLKSGGFFDVANFPTASFAVTSVEETADQFTYMITGDLTLKGITNEISFEAVIYEKNDHLYASADTEIDRTRWGITAGSNNFFENLGDNFISDMVAISLSLVAHKTNQ